MGKPQYIPHFATSSEKPSLLQLNQFKGLAFRNRNTIPYSEGEPTFSDVGKHRVYKHTVHSQYTLITYTVTLATTYVQGCYQPLSRHLIITMINKYSHIQ